MGGVAWRRSRPVLSNPHLDQQSNSQERTSTSSSGDCLATSIGTSFDTGDIFGVSLIVSPSTKFDATPGPAVDVPAELNGTLNGTRNGAIFLAGSHSEHANLGMGGIIPTVTGSRS